MNRPFIAIVIAGLALGALSGCTDSKPFPSQSPSAATATAVPSPTTDSGRVALTYETFLNGLYSLTPAQQAEIDALSKQYPSADEFDKLTAKQKDNVVNTVRKIDPALNTLDVSNLDVQQRFITYATLLYLGSLGSPQATTDAAPVVRVDSKQVKVSGDSATVPVAALSVAVSGTTPQPYPTDAPLSAQNMPFKKVGGKWLINAKQLAAEGASPTASATPSASPSGK